MACSEQLEVTEYLTNGPAHALAGLLGVSVPDARDVGLPMLWHLVYLLDRHAQSDLGPDGHPFVDGVPSPPGPGQRRLFAGGRVRTLAPLRCGRPATRRARVLRWEDKVGRTGTMTFATVGVEIVQDGRLVVTEEQEIVYRAAPARTGPKLAPDQWAPPIEKQPGDWDFEINPIALFRFSALTYNAHRIHYDRDYVRDVEGYAGLLVHGPLQALLMAEAARARLGETISRGVSEFEYRLVSPLCDHEGLLVHTEDSERGLITQVLSRHGRETARGHFTVQA